METIRAMFEKPLMGRRIWMLVTAHIIMGAGVALLKYVTLGNDPFSAMMMVLTSKTPLSYGMFCMAGNCIFFVAEFLWGKKYIGLGTLVNWFLLGYIVMFWYGILGGVHLPPQSMMIRIPLCVLAVVVIAFSLSLYQSADVGIAPFDCLALILNEKLHLPFAVCRVLVDGSALLICWLAGGLLGLGTVLVMVGLGPVAAFFNQRFSEKLLEI